MKRTTTIEMRCDERHFVCLEAIEAFDDNSGIMGLLTVRSGEFSCVRHRFCFDHFDKFAHDLSRLYKALQGQARLGHTYERDFILLSASPVGHITVQGEIAEFGQNQQKLTFQFSTDQTFLAMMIQSTEKALAGIRK